MQLFVCLCIVVVLCFFISLLPSAMSSVFFFFNDTATTEIYTLSLHDALPILKPRRRTRCRRGCPLCPSPDLRDRKSTRLNSSHQIISYAVFCLKKKKNCQKSGRRQRTQREAKSSLVSRIHLTTLWPDRSTTSV